MKWRAYINSFRLGLNQLTNYRAEMWFQIISKILSLIGIGILWSLILKNAPKSETTEMASYLLLSNGVRELVDATNLRFASRIMDEVKDGSLSSSLLRPINPYRLSYFSYFGSRGVNFLMSIVLIGAGVMMNPLVNIKSIVLFVFATKVGFLLSYWINLFVGWISFWAVTAPNIRALFIHIVRVFSGAMIPITYFPGPIRTFAMLTPFPALAYLPAKILQKGWSENFANSLMSALVWIVIFALLEKVIWKAGLKKYEAVGI